MYTIRKIFNPTNNLHNISKEWWYPQRWAYFENGLYKSTYSNSINIEVNKHFFNNNLINTNRQVDKVIYIPFTYKNKNIVFNVNK